nr:gustatory receptor 27 [Papilio memnon]
MIEARRTDSANKNLKHKMNLEEISKKIVNCIKPSLIVEYCYGIFRYRITGSTLSSIDRKMKIFGIIITLIFIASVIFLGIVPKMIFIIQNKINMGKFMRELPWVVCSIHYAVYNLLILRQSENNLKILESLANIDINLHASMNRDYYQTSQKECKKLFTGFFLFCILMTTTVYVSEEEINFSFIPYLFLYFERKIGIVVLCEFLHLLRHRMLLINNYLKKFMAIQKQHTSYKSLLKKEMEGNINFIGTVSVTNNKISDLANVYKNVGDVSNIINNVFNFFITTSIISTFVFIISFFWASLNYMKFTEVEKTALTMIKIVTWSFVELFSVYIISYYCEKNLEVKNEIVMILNKIVIDDKLPKRMKRQAKVFMEITDIWPMSIQAYNMFVINKNLILKFVGICTSYLIVVIQVDEFVQD